MRCSGVLDNTYLSKKCHNPVSFDGNIITPLRLIDDNVYDEYEKHTNNPLDRDTFFEVVLKWFQLIGHYGLDDIAGVVIEGLGHFGVVTSPYSVDMDLRGDIVGLNTDTGGRNFFFHFNPYMTKDGIVTFDMTDRINEDYSDKIVELYNKGYRWLYPFDYFFKGRNL